MSRTLTKEEVDVLFYFCENEGTYDYDLQIEIVGKNNNTKNC